MDDAYQNEDYHNDSILAKLSQTQEVQSGPEHARIVDGEDEETFSKGRSSSRHVDAKDRKRTYLAPVLFLDEMEGRAFGKRHFIIFCVTLFCSLILVITALLMASLWCIPKCPSGWQNVGKTCYLICSEAKKWEDGRDDCQNQGADLIIIGDKQEQDFLNYKMESYREFWIGLKHAGGETWKWVNGTSILSQSLRTLEGFEDIGDGPCATSKKEENNHKWSRIDCTKMHPYVCEKYMYVNCVLQSPLGYF
nr:PREDICTED: snaclec 3 [Anolis carolinensis]|eukprot:XP_008102429.1 PREDICTED: snaclec 3 [Anolis carolinensis]